MSMYVNEFIIALGIRGANSWLPPAIFIALPPLEMTSESMLCCSLLQHVAVRRNSSRILAFCTPRRSPKGWQKRMAEKAKDPKIPKILQNEKFCRKCNWRCVFASWFYNDCPQFLDNNICFALNFQRSWHTMNFVKTALNAPAISHTTYCFHCWI